VTTGGTFGSDHRISKAPRHVQHGRMIIRRAGGLRRAAGEQPEPAEQLDRGQIQQSEQHSPRSCHDHMVTPEPKVTACVTSFGTAHHSDIPEHYNLLPGERYGCPLPWPPGVHQLTGTLMLPPTTTPRGPITWRQPPRQDSLLLSREIDVFGALRTALSARPPGEDPSPDGGPRA
jgi:hypothetical protein